MFFGKKTCHGSFAIFYKYANLPWEFLPSFMGKQTHHGSFCHLLWANKPVVRIFAIFYGQINLSQEFLPSFMGIQTYHGSFCHLLWANKSIRSFCHLLWAYKPTMGVFAIFYKQTNLLQEFLPSFMGKQTYHGSFCHLL